VLKAEYAQGIDVVYEVNTHLWIQRNHADSDLAKGIMRQPTWDHHGVATGDPWSPKYSMQCLVAKARSLHGMFPADLFWKSVHLLAWLWLQLSDHYHPYFQVRQHMVCATTEGFFA